MKNKVCLFSPPRVATQRPVIYHAPISYWQIENVFTFKLHLHLQQIEIESFTYAPNQPWPGFPAPPDQDNQAWKNIPTRIFLGAWDKIWLGSSIHMLPFQ